MDTGGTMASITQVAETDIVALVEMAREKVADDKKVIPWIIERSPSWRNAGYTEIVKAIKEANITLE